MFTEEHVILPSSILTIEGQSVIFTILSSQHATPLHISRALDIQLDACTTSDRQGNRVPIVKSVTFIDNGEELRGRRRRRPRGEEFPPYGFYRCTIPFPCSITLLNFSFFEEYTTVQLPDLEVRQALIVEWRFWTRIKWRFLNRDWEEHLFAYWRSFMGGRRTWDARLPGGSGK